MKVNTIYHKPNEISKERKKDVRYVNFSKNEEYHPLMKEREFVRALNATKIDRMMSKPFISALSYHKEGIHVLCRHPSRPVFASGSFDNQVFVWNMNEKAASREYNCEYSVKGLGMDLNGCLYAGQGTFVKCLDGGTNYACKSEVVCLEIGEDVHAGTFMGVEMFDIERGCQKQCVKTEHSYCIQSSPVMPNVVCIGQQKGFTLLDSRIGARIDTIRAGKTNDVAFNPKHGHILVSANEDGCVYNHDIRYLQETCGVYRGHANAVVAVEFDPLGVEIASGSSDKTIRIFEIDERKSRDVYYAKRMQNVFGLKYSHDSQFIVSGSDDGSIRLWRSHASIRPGPMSRREKDNLEYSKALIGKYRDVEEINRISRHRFLPSTLKISLKNIHESYEAAQRRKAKRESQNK
ncbi:hypothetical protein HK407_02g03090 [Ordospora pajunii]|uniref:uncharacterized protein n=1 Tax=Ordospora pajunii TaxID=3039483 RepID=UPI00295286B5|nr:uncharacterized protein HK407_02g03090 [Ordospora pajunii]KAH9412085.1 hypothetical protein HK407_02g03090 [Ordospora pajunii]